MNPGNEERRVLCFAQRLNKASVAYVEKSSRTGMGIMENIAAGERVASHLLKSGARGCSGAIYSKLTGMQFKGLRKTRR